MVYCATSDIRLMTNLTTSDVSDADVTSLIAEATKQLNADINVHVEREFIQYIDGTRENKIDNSNTTYYVLNSRGKFLADSDDDGDLDTSDITVYLVQADGTETTATVSTIDAGLGKFVLSSAPNNVDMFVTYQWAYEDPTTPSPRIKLACIFLTAAYCYAKINFGRSPKQSWGNIKLLRHMDSYNMYYQRYLDVIRQINNQSSDNVSNINTF